MNQSMIAKISLQKRIGAGYFGEVYEAIDPVLGKVAVKILSKLPDEDDVTWEQRKKGLLHEGQRLKDAEHENIVRVYQVLESQDENSIWLVMEFCENGSLQGQFENGPMSLRQLRTVLCDAALGLHAIHARGLIHRDIKPANILLNLSQRAKLADFGLVTDNLIMGYAYAMGYIDHFAKETFDLGLSSIRTDVWAFGMTVYRLLNGMQFYNELPSPRDRIPAGGFAQGLPWLPHIPNIWRRFVRQLMHDEPSRRIQDAVQILKWLEKLPVEPNWYCTYSKSEVAWHRETSTRRIEVKWIRYSPRKHEWEARSLPLKDGRHKQLASSGGVVNYSLATKGLQKFFLGT